MRPSDNSRLAVVCALTLLSCGDADQARSVEVPEAPDATASPDTSGHDGEDGGATDAQAEPRGPAPAWPRSEQTLDLEYRGIPRRAKLVLAPNPSRLDVQFNVDTTASFSAEIDAIQRDLSREIIPRLRKRVADTQLGVSRFADFALVPFGRPVEEGSPDKAYQLLCPITDSLSRVSAAVYALDRPLADGGDEPEASAEALYQLATGAGYILDGRTIIEPFDRDSAAAQGGGTIGGVGFRQGAFRVVVHITDAPSHKPDDYARRGLANTHDLQSATAALQALGARVVGICSSGAGNSAYAKVRAELSEIALSTGAHTATQKNGLCPTGRDGSDVASYQGRCPWVFDVDFDGTGLSDTIAQAVVGLLDDAGFSAVHAEVGDDPLGLVERIEVDPVTQRTGLSKPATSDQLPEGNPDGVKDTYLDVRRAHQLGFAVVLSNTRIAPAEYDQRFRVSIRLVGDGIVLEEHTLGVRVPAASQPPSAADTDTDAGK